MMKKLEELIKDNIGWVLFILGVVVIGSAFTPCIKDIWNDENGEATRSIVLTLGALGAGYGLILAGRRVAVGQKQAKTAEKNLFNDRLSRVIEALGHDTVSIRNAGVRLAGSLLKDADEGSNDWTLVCEILHGFIRDRAVKTDKNGPKTLEELTAEEQQNRSDISTAIKILFAHLEPKDRATYPLNDLVLRQNFTKADLRGANLSEARLMRADLSGANLSGANLSGANLFCAGLSEADLTEANLLDVQNIDLDSIIYEKGRDPQNLPEGLTLPANRAYVIGEDGEKIFC